MSHHEHAVYKLNCGEVSLQETLPLPPKEDFPINICTYEDSPDEPKFDPEIHLDLHRPDFIRTLKNFDKQTELLKVDSSHGSAFAYSSPFQVRSAP